MKGCWTRAQRYAIIAAYWRKGWPVHHVAAKLNTSPEFVRAAYDHIAWTEGLEPGATLGENGRDPPTSST